MHPKILHTRAVAIMLLFALTFLPALPSQAVTLNCNLKISEAEKIICSDHELSSAYGDLDQTYDEISRKAAPNIQNIMKDSQINWEHYLSDGVVIINKFGGRLNAHDWLTREISARKSFMSESRKNSGDLTFYLIEYYKIIPVSTSFETNVGRVFEFRFSTFPQINNPKNNSETRFNKVVNHLPNDENDSPDDQDPSNHNDWVEIVNIFVNP